MSTPELVIIRTGAANLASVNAAFRRLGLEPLVSDEPEVARRARLLVLPGVGAFGPASERLNDSGLSGVLRERVEQDRPLLAICLGLQLLFDDSEESPGARGLGVFRGTVRKFRGAARVPQMGWNTITPTSAGGLLEAGHAYFANSYRVESIPPGCSGATSTYCGAFAAAIERGSLLACQFHPELSGRFGEALLARWVKRCAAPEGMAC